MKTQPNEEQTGRSAYVLFSAAAPVEEESDSYDKPTWEKYKMQSSDPLIRMANYVKYNVNTQVSNLEMIHQLIHETDLSSEQAELFSNYSEMARELSELTKTVDETLKLTQYKKQGFDKIELQPFFTKVRRCYTAWAEQRAASVYSDFSEEPVIHFEPDLLHFIFKKFIAASLENGAADKTPEIKVFTVVKESKTHLVLENNAKAPWFACFNDGSEQLLSLCDLKTAVENCGAEFFAEVREGYGNRYTLVF